jgi:hypothetical protein
MASFVCGLHTDEQYSIVGRTEVLFADDCILYRKIRSIKDTIILQDDLNKLADWEQKWGMDFHPDKVLYQMLPLPLLPVVFGYSEMP